MNFLKARSPLLRSRALLLTCRRWHSIDHRIIQSIYDLETPKKKPAFKTLSQAVDAFLLQYNKEHDEDNGKDRPKAAAEGLLFDGNAYYHKNTQLSKIIAENTVAMQDRLQVRTKRAKLPKLGFEDSEGFYSYTTFLKALYSNDTAQTNLPDFIDSSGPSISNNKKIRNGPNNASVKYYSDLFDAYLKLPQPRPDYIPAHHLENLISAVMKVDHLFLKYNAPQIRRKFIFDCFTLMRDLLEGEIPLGLMEKNHLLFLKHFFYEDRTKFLKQMVHVGNMDYEKIKNDEKGNRSGGTKGTFQSNFNEQQQLKEDLQKSLEKDKRKILQDYQLYSKKIAAAFPGGNLPPVEVSTINSILKGAIKLNHTELINVIIADYGKLETQFQIPADRFIYSELLFYFATIKDIENFRDLLKSLNSLKITLDTSLSNHIIFSLLKIGDLANAKAVFHSMMDMALEDKGVKLSKENKGQHNRRIKGLDLLRSLMSKFPEVNEQVNSQVEKYDKSLLYLVDINHETVSSFLRYYSTNFHYGFKEVAKMIVLLEQSEDLRSNFLNEYNEKQGKISEDKKLSFEKIHPSYKGQALNADTQLNHLDCLTIIKGFSMANDEVFRADSGVALPDKHSENEILSWNVQNLQILIKYILESHERSNLRLDNNLIAKIMSSFSKTLKNGNISPTLRLDKDTIAAIIASNKKFQNSEDSVFDQEETHESKSQEQVIHKVAQLAVILDRLQSNIRQPYIAGKQKERKNQSDTIASRNAAKLALAKVAEMKF